MKLAGKKIYVGLSGGVDSSVSAYLLKKAGADVTGVFIQGWYPSGMPCTWREDRKDAMRVAARLGIPFYTLNAEDEYKKGVIDYLLSEYKAGRTPNPDVMCNREVKFGAFYRFAKKKGADAIATGHYARQIDGDLLRGVDPEKDQSYFLWAVPKEALAHTIFPLGEYVKGTTREIARKANLPVADKKDSQGICFLGTISVEAFLEKEFGSEEGDAIDESGTAIGKHTGVLLHTLGERISLKDAPPGPWYVVGKDVERNVLRVSKKRGVESTLTSLTLRDVNGLNGVEGGVEAQFRYHGPIITGTYKDQAFTPDAPFPEPVASGQSLVIYKGDQVLGGGIIA